MNDPKRFNPLVLDPEDYEKLFDDEFGEKEDDQKSDSEFEHLCGGGRRRKPITLDY